MKPRKYKADIILTDPHHVYHFYPTKKELEDFLDISSDQVLHNIIDTDRYRVRVTDNETGIIYEHGTTQECFRYLYHLLVYEM